MEVSSGHYNQILLQLDRLCIKLERHCPLFSESKLVLWELGEGTGILCLVIKVNIAPFLNFIKCIFFFQLIDYDNLYDLLL